MATVRCGLDSALPLPWAIACAVLCRAVLCAVQCCAVPFPSSRNSLVSLLTAPLTPQTRLTPQLPSVYNVPAAVVAVVVCWLLVVVVVAVRGDNNMVKHQNQELLMGHELARKNTLRPRGRHSILNLCVGRQPLNKTPPDDIR